MCELCLLVLLLVLTNFCFLSDFFFEFSFVDRSPSEPLLSTVIYIIDKQLRKGSTESWTRVFGFKIQVSNHYTMDPIQNLRMLTLAELPLLVGFYSLFAMITVCLLFGIFLVFFQWLVSFLTRCVNCKVHHRISIEKRFHRELSSGLWIPSPRCLPLHHRTYSDHKNAYLGWVLLLVGFSFLFVMITVCLLFGIFLVFCIDWFPS